MSTMTTVGSVWLLIEDGEVVAIALTEPWAQTWVQRARTHKRVTKKVPVIKP